MACQPKSDLDMRLSGYQFDEKIGEGGMAAVFKGRQLSLARPVAIKVLSQQMRKHSRVRQAFERESLIVARLNHPNIIQVIDRGVTDQDTPYFVMEYVDGMELLRLMREAELPLQRKIGLCLQICKALAYAHKNGVIHRDIKPGNVIVDGEFNVKVLDFGIAQFHAGREYAGEEHAGKESEDEACTAGEQPAATGAGEVMGTLTYMAPELSHSAGGATFKSDIYSLGVVMHELFTGQLPQFVDSDADPFPAAVPADLKRLIGQCLQAQPERRPAAVTDIHNRLLLLLEGAHLDARQVRRAGESLDKKTFTLLDILSENRFGAVYLFVEKNSGRQLVVKKISGSHAGYDTSKRMATLNHRYLAKVHGVSQNPRAFIVVMDYLRGGSLRDGLVRPYQLGHFLRIARQVCSGLAHAHGKQIVHGNLRASNILFDGQGKVQIADFGLPPHYDVAIGDVAIGQQPKDEQNWYRLPGETLSPQSDIYACGVIFYQMLVGELPRWHRGRVETGRAFKRLPERLQSVVSTMLQPDPGRRFRHINLVLEALDECNDDVPTVVVAAETAVAGRPPQDRRKALLLLLLLVLLFLIVVDAGAVLLFTHGLLNPSIAQEWLAELFGV